MYQMQLSKKLQKLILQEFKMLSMQPMGSMMGHHDSEPVAKSHSHDHSSKGSVSREDCCAAIICLIECCSCPTTKQAIIECCEDIMSGHYDC